jgi:hypothetical protein
VFPCVRCSKPTKECLCEDCKIYLIKEEPTKDEYDILADYYIRQLNDLGDRERLKAILEAIKNLQKHKNELEAMR